MRHKSFPGEDELVLVAQCPICDGDALTDLGTPVSHEGTPLHYDRCDRCNLIFMNPRPKQDWYNHLYQAEFWEVKNAKKNTHGQVKNQILKEAQWAEKFIALLDEVGFSRSNPNPDVLEIGCAYGLIGKLVAQHFSGKAFGVEPNDEARAFAESVTGIEVFGNTMDELIADSREGLFDLIIFSHVLENIVDPIAALGAARRLLKDNGMILIDTPNNFVRKSWHIHHPYCFTKPALDALLGKAELEIDKARTWPRPKYVLGPIYLSVLARKGALRETNAAAPGALAWNRFGGRLRFNLLNRGFVANLNRHLALRRWAPSDDSKAEIKRISAAVQKTEHAGG